MKIASLVQRSWLLAGLFLANCAVADDAPKNSAKQEAKCVSVSGVLLVKEAEGTWNPVKPGTALPSGKLLVGMPRAELVSASGNILVRLLADIGQRGPFPVLEAGIILHDAAGVDLDITLGRGVVVLENLKKEVGAKVRLRVADETWVLDMQKPGTKVGLEIFGRHAPGFLKTIDEKSDVPTTDVLMLVLNGQAFLDTGKEGFGMHAPPGVARFHWDSILRQHSFQRLDKLPETVVKPLDDKETKIFHDVAKSAAKLNAGNLGQALDSLINSGSKMDRLAGVTLAGAVDDLPRLFGVLMESKDAATRDHAVLVLRHWIGREPGQLTKLQTVLHERKKLTDVQIRNLVHLLLGFTNEERSDPDTYVVLLAYLAHKNQAVRTLAHWHLVRLAPAGKDIAFDAADSEQDRQQAVQRWHALIPDGQLPPHPRDQARSKS